MMRKNIATVIVCVICLGFLAVILVAPAYPSVRPSTTTARDVHAYFTTLKARPEKVADYSLRDQAQIDKYRQGKIASTVTYDPARDTDPRKQDAAKVFIPADLEPSASARDRNGRSFSSIWSSLWTGWFPHPGLPGGTRCLRSSAAKKPRSAHPHG